MLSPFSKNQAIQWDALESAVQLVNERALERDFWGHNISREDYGRVVDARAVAWGAGLLVEKKPSRLEWGEFLGRFGRMSLDNSLPLIVSLRVGLIRTLADAESATISGELAPAMARGELAPAFAYTEGADPFSFKTTASKVQGGYTLSGRKDFVTSAATADFAMVYAALEKPGSDLGCFLVDLRRAGIRLEACDISGLRSAGICTLHLKEAFVPAEHVVARKDGLSHVQRFLNDRRLFLVCPLVGQMESILERCLGHLSSSQRYNAPVASMQQVQALVGQMYHLIQVSRSVMRDALIHSESEDFNQLWDPACSVAKSEIVDNAIEVAQIAQRLMGGAGYLRGQHLERHLRDFFGFIPGGGSRDTLMVDLGIFAISQESLGHETVALSRERKSSQPLGLGEKE